MSMGIPLGFAPLHQDRKSSKSDDQRKEKAK